jgi:butyrate kinase
MSRNELEARETAARSRAAEIEARAGALLGAVAPGADDPLLALFAGEQVAAAARKSRWGSLVLNPGSTSTKVAVYSGLQLLAAEEMAHGPDEPGGIERRVERLRAWFESRQLVPGEISGIATQGGMMAPVRAGTYRVCDAMLADLAASRSSHPINIAAALAVAVARLTAPDTMVTVTDPASIDERDPVSRVTGSARVRCDQAVAHFLNHRAAARLLHHLLGAADGALGLISCHMGGGMSAVRHAGGRMARVSPAFGGMPSANRSGALPLLDVLRLADDHRYSLDDLRRDVTREGGLLALAGTDDFRVLASFAAGRGSPEQQRKAELVRRFFASRVAAAVLGLAEGEDPVDAILLTGGLARDEEFCLMVARSIRLPVPVIRLPGSLEQQALAAGLLGARSGAGRRLSYVEAREHSAATREEQERLLDTILVDRRAARSAGPPRTVDDLLDAARAGEPPVIALVGADNEEALLAVKSALALRPRPLARFLLLGPHAAVSRLAWELDVPVDGENAALVDTDDPVTRASGLLLDGSADTLMKGSCMTSAVLKGFLGYLKAAGRKSPGMLLSHLALFELSGRSGLLGVTDAAMNTSPDVEARLGILDNALVAMRLLGYERPKVAVISAVEKPSDAVTSSMEGRAIAERLAGRDDVIVEGPLSVDIALSPAAAREKKYAGHIRGDADLLLVPDIDAGNAVYKAFTVISGATLGGAIIGGDVPIILTSRGDSSRTKLASVALACLLIQRGREGGDRHGR